MNRYDRFSRRASRGVALVIALILTTIVLVTCVALTSLGIQQSAVAYNLYSSTASTDAAMAGLNEAIAMIGQNSSWSGTELEGKSLLHTVGSYTVTFNKGLPYYSTNNAGGSNPTGYGGVTVPSGFVYIISTGNVKGQVRRVAAMVKTGTSGSYPYAVASMGQVEIQNGDINAVNSNQAMVGNPPMYPLLNAGANVATGSTQSGAVSTQSNGHIYGSVYYPPGGSSSVMGGGNVTGAVLAASQPLSYTADADPYAASLPALPFPSTTSASTPLPPGKYGALSISGTTKLWLTKGKYSFDSISISGQASINITGVPNAGDQVYVYIRNEGNNIAGNGFVNSTNIPAKLLIAAGPHVHDLSIMGNGNLFGILYAPQTEVTIGGNGALVGAVVTSHLHLEGNNAAIYYDQALGSTGGSGQKPSFSGFNHLP